MKGSLIVVSLALMAMSMAMAVDMAVDVMGNS
jgi:hypothetical protein